MDFTVSPKSLITGAVTDYNFTFVSGHEMISQQTVVIDLTQEIWFGEDDPLTIGVNEGI